MDRSERTSDYYTIEDYYKELDKMEGSELRKEIEQAEVVEG